MTTSPILLIPLIDQAQAQKEVTANEAFEALEQAFNDRAAIDVTAGNVSVAAALSTRAVLLHVAGATTAGRTVTIPAAKRMFLVRSDGANTQAFAVVRGATSISMAIGEAALFYADGTTDGLVRVATSRAGTGTVTSVDLTAPAEGIMVSGGPVTTSGSLTLALANDLEALEGLTGTGFAKRTGVDTWALGSPSSSDLADFNEAVDDRVAALLLAAGLTLTYDDTANSLTISLPAQPYIVGTTFAGKPAANQILLVHPFTIATSFPSGLTNAKGWARGAAATAQYDVDIRKRTAAGVESSIGTIRWAASGVEPTFIFSSTVSFAIGDSMVLVGQATPDTTLADIGISLKGTR